MKPMNEIMVHRLDGQLIKKIDEYEATIYSKPTDVYKRIVKLLPADGEVALLGVMASSQDSTVALIFTHNGEEKSRNFPIAEKGSIGYILFMYAFTVAPAYQILHNIYGFEYIYAIGQMLQDRIKPGDITTYPRLVKRIKPTDFTDDVQLDVYRAVIIGENRSDEHVTFLKALSRSTAVMSERGTSTNINEIFPVMMFGNNVAFGTYIPFPATIVGPFDNECILPSAEEYNLTAEEAVLAIGAKRYTLDHTSGDIN